MNNSLEDLYKKVSNESTPTALDNLILNAAKQSCEETTTTRKPKNWLYVLSTAAVLVMGISVVFNLQNQNSEMKVSPESLDYSVLKEDLRTKTVAAPPLEPLPRPQKKRKRITPDALNQAGLLGEVIAQEPNTQKERNSSTTKIENKPQVILEKVLPVESAIRALELEEVSADDEFRQTSDDVIVTGMRRAAKPVPELKKENNLLPKPIEINKLEALVMAKKYKQAQDLLEQLQNTYPNYNWQKYKALIPDSKK